MPNNYHYMDQEVWIAFFKDGKFLQQFYECRAGTYTIMKDLDQIKHYGRCLCDHARIIIFDATIGKITHTFKCAK